MLTRRSWVILGGLTALCVLWAGQAFAQQADNPDRPRRRFDPAEMRKRMMDGVKERLGASDEDWKALSPKVEKVMTLSRDARGGGMGMMMMGRRRRRPDAEGQERPANAPEMSATAKAAQGLMTVLENKEAKAEEIKTALQSLRDARAKAAAELGKARKALKEIVTVRQEAQLVMMGMLE